jgi:general secretion pathway protein D
MRSWRAGIYSLLAGALCASVCLAADTPSPAAPCSASSDAALCQPSPSDLKKDRKAAHKAFERGLKLQESQNLDRAFSEFQEASRLSPTNAEYVAAREMTREHLAGDHLDRGSKELAAGRRTEAMSEFQMALALDPQNEYAQQRAFDALAPAQIRTSGPPQVVDSANTLVAKPIDGLHDFHYRGDSRGLITAVASSYGLTVVFDDTFATRHVRFDMDQVNFATAMQGVSAVTKSFSVPLESTVLYAAPDNPENHRLYDRMGMRTFFIPGVETPNDLNEVLNGLRTLFEFRFISLNAGASTITIRGPMPMVEAATQFLSQLDGSRPQVLIELQVLQVSHTYARDIGLHVPNQFNLFNIPAAALTALGGQNIQDLINQLIASGGINQAGNQSIAALLAQLQGQQNSIFSQPLATFGGGLTFMGLSLDQLSSVLSLNESSVRSLQHVTLRAAQEKEATFKLGSRYPVLNASFSPISNSAAIAGVLGNQSYTAPFPSVSYEDLGLTLKAKTLVHNSSDITLDLHVQFRSLGATAVNGVPIIENRELASWIVLKDGEPAGVAGMVSESDQRSLSGLPTFSRIPGFGVLSSRHSKQMEDDELLILITPHVVSSSERKEPPEIWLSR